MRAPGDTKFEHGPQPARTSRCETCQLHKVVTGPVYPSCDDCMRMKGFVKGKWGWYQPGNNGGNR